MSTEITEAHDAVAKEDVLDAWDTRLETIHVGRQPIAEEPLVTISVKFPASMVNAMDALGTNRSDFIRRAVASRLGESFAEAAGEQS